MAAALEAGFSDYVMLDPDRIGGATGSRRAAGLASAYDRKVLLHFFPEVSAHAGGNSGTPLARIC
jgi:mandelate racemase